MRPVNLIPPEERRGERAPSRTGGLAYVVIGVLAVALLAVVGVVLTDNQIADRQAQVTELKGQLDQATAEANRLKSYADFATMQQTRAQTVSTLAKSRFDWYRVLYELGLVIPNNVWLTNLEGSVSPEAAASATSSGSGSSGASTTDLSTQITGPSLTIEGCAAGHDAVAGFMGALRDIDGVTRVAVTSSQRVAIFRRKRRQHRLGIDFVWMRGAWLHRPVRRGRDLRQGSDRPNDRTRSGHYADDPGGPDRRPGRRKRRGRERGEAGEQDDEVRQPAVGEGSPGREHPDPWDGPPVKRSDMMVLAVVGVVGVIAVFWFAVLAPKRSHASDLSSQVSDLQSQVSTQQQTIATAQQARANFAPSYHKLVVLGKAVPADSEQASLLVQLNTLADRAGVSFQSLTLNASANASAVAPPPATTTTTTDTTSTSTTSTDTTSTDTTSTDTTAAPTGTPTATTTGLPTEASAAVLPLGAAIGPAGLPVMPYDLTFTGGYFQISKFLRSVDDLVHTPGSHITVSGRLVTVNSFNLAPPNASTTATAAKSAELQADLSVMTYVTPAEQGLTGGATPAAPAPTASATAVPTAAPAPTTP